MARADQRDELVQDVFVGERRVLLLVLHQRGEAVVGHVVASLESGAARPGRRREALVPDAVDRFPEPPNPREDARHGQVVEHVLADHVRAERHLLREPLRRVARPVVAARSAPREDVLREHRLAKRAKRGDVEELLDVDDRGPRRFQVAPDVFHRVVEAFGDDAALRLEPLLVKEAS